MKEVENETWEPYLYKGTTKPNECGLWEGEWAGFSWSPRVMQHYKDRERCPSTKEEFKFQQEVVADLKVFNLKSDLKDEV